MKINLSKIASTVHHSPKVRTVARCASRGLPFAGVYGAGTLLYHYSPDVRGVLDNTRELMNESPMLAEGIVSGLLRGVIPDLVAHGFKNFNLRRFALMTGFGAFVGAVVLRVLYNDVQPELFPGSGLSTTVKKIAFDQAVYTPFFFLPMFFTFSNFVKQEPWQGFLGRMKKDIVKIMPLNWSYWILGCALIYNVPQDLSVHLSSVLSLVWFAILSGRGFSNQEQKT